jgi:hypothetical protein
VGKIVEISASSIRFYILRFEMKRFICFFSCACCLGLIGQTYPHALKGIWRQNDLGISIQIEQHGLYAYGKIISIGKQRKGGGLNLEAEVRPGHFILTELKFLKPGIWTGKWNGSVRPEGKRILLKSLSPDKWQVRMKGGPLWFKVKNGEFVPER